MKFLESLSFFYITIALFCIGAGWIAVGSLYPMAFDEEFHYGLIKIYATSLLPYSIQHTTDMAQFGAATGDASYLFHYLMSYPYRILAGVGLPDMAIIILLRFINIAFVVAALVVFRKVLREARLSGAVANITLLLVTLIPIFPLLAAHINYDNLLLLIIAWCVLCIVRITSVVRSGMSFPLGQSVQLAVAVLIGMSVKYAFLPIALGMFIWILWLLVLGYRMHKQTVSSQTKSLRARWKSQSNRKRKLMIAAVVLSLFFASHYITNMLSYGSPIPSCERVFSESECTAYGPWNRNKNMEARKSESFEPMPYANYMAAEWFPGMTQRLMFAVAGKTNDFQTKLPLPVLVYMYVIASCVGAICFIVQVVRKKGNWFGAFALLLAVIYSGVLSFQLYGDYVDTAEPVAINGRYLIPLLPLVGAAMIQAISTVFHRIDRRMLTIAAVVFLLVLIPAGAGIGTYIVQSEPHWFWPGFGQSSHAALQSVFDMFVFAARY